ncbi:MAG TPA: peptidase U32 family protein, partial [Myxococcales bacterium]
ELLAPAGDRACLQAALEAGADAVYLGLTALNARRNARNFSEAELASACELAHGMGRRVHLTLNIDLAQDELSRAARMLELASRLKVDAVLVRDPALLALKAHFPELEYHLSTQACVASSADVEAARELGARRVVLARELSLSEIAAASQVEGVETEVFALGALCFSVSGRCLLSSWVGGRSGNRGQCTSPCRVAWTLDGKPGGTPLSPHDVSLAHRVGDLRAAGVRALKIEGRMKNPSWVRSAVGLLRKAIDGAATPEELSREAQRRPATARRAVSSAFLDGLRHTLVDPPGAESEQEPEGPAADAKKPAEPPIREPAAAVLREADALAHPGPRRAPDRVRLSSDQAPIFLAKVQPPAGAIVEGLSPESLRALVQAHPAVPMVAALPGVFFEDERGQVEALATEAAKLGVRVEANSWGGWLLARRSGARMVAGPGLGLLNALAARELLRRGFEEATASVETDALKLDALVSRAPLPCSAVVFGRPALLSTRVELSSKVAGAELEDRRSVRLRARRERSLWELRPVEPFDLRAGRLPASLAHAVVDLVGSPDPVAEWEQGAERSTRFNYERTLS